MNNHGPGQPVVFTLNTSKLSPAWEVFLNDGGELIVTAVGRRSGRILIEPRSHGNVKITSERILKEKGEADER